MSSAGLPESGGVREGLIAEFRTANEMLAAIAALRERGYRELESFSPFPVPGTDERLGLKRPWLPWFVLAAGLMGGLLGYAIQWYANVWHYPQNAGGRPAHAIPAFIPTTFESAVLGAALAGFVVLLLSLGLPRLWHPLFEIDGFERASIDRFWVTIAAHDPEFDPVYTPRALEPFNPISVVEMAPP